MNVDRGRDLLFGVIALQMGFATEGDFAKVMTLLPGRAGRTAESLFAEEGLLAAYQVDAIRGLLEAQLKAHGGDAAFPSLVRAARKAQLGKRYRNEVARFNFDLERNLLCLQEELVSGAYRPSPHRLFPIREPKPRLIAAPAYRDRVLHHALCAIIDSILDRTFIHDTYACRKGKGTHAAIERFTRFARGGRVVLADNVRRPPSTRGCRASGRMAGVS